MSTPSVSVIMPVYNAGRFVQKAIESILQQTFKDFEFIIINDQSTDNSDSIIRSFSDERILYFTQEQNAGVVAAMNKGLEIAKAKYIAVMHADDISLPKRLEQQTKYLDEHLSVAVVAGRSVFINEEDKPTGLVWKFDEKNNTYKKIKAAMLWGNCISHPTVLMRSEVVKKYKYQSSDLHEGYAVEDYPLWLNIVSDGYEIEKLQDLVLFYRVHENSATTAFLRKKNPFLINYYSKKSYLRTRRLKGKLNAFDRKVQITMYINYIASGLKNIKMRMTNKNV